MTRAEIIYYAKFALYSRVFLFIFATNHSQMSSCLRKNSTIDNVVSKVNLNTFKYESLTDSVFSNQKVGQLAIIYFQTLSEVPHNFKWRKWLMLVLVYCSGCNKLLECAKYCMTDLVRVSDRKTKGLCWHLVAHSGTAKEGIQMKCRAEKKSIVYKRWLFYGSWYEELLWSCCIESSDCNMKTFY